MSITPVLCATSTVRQMEEADSIQLYHVICPAPVKAGPWHYFHNNMGWRYDVTWELSADSAVETPFGLPSDLLWAQEWPGMPRLSSRFSLVLDRLCIARLKAARGADLVGPAPVCRNPWVHLASLTVYRQNIDAFLTVRRH
jgi:hypothetical protein